MSIKPNEKVRLYSGPSPFETYSKLSKELKTFDFGHGSPDSHPPTFLKDALLQATKDEQNQHQYCRPMGHPEFAAQISKEYSASFNRKLDPQWEICAGVGATGIIANALYSFCQKGDELICFQPCFLGYPPLFHIIGANVKWVPFKDNKLSQKFELDREAFERSFTDKTRVVFINNPHNPCGHIFSKEDLEFMASVIKKHPKVLCIMDEVYDKFVFNGKPFFRMANIPGMWERTVSIYSSGKVFSCTGWRVGFSIAPEYLTRMIGSSQTWNIFCMNTLSAKAIQLGMEYAAENPYEGKASYYEWLRSTFEWRAKQIGDIIEGSPLGMKMYNPDGGYFTIANIEDTVKQVPTKYFYKNQARGSDKPLKYYEDWRSLDSPDYAPDSACSIYFTKECGFTTVPVSAFWDNNPEGNVLDYQGTNFVRFALCKNNTFINRWADDMQLRNRIRNSKPNITGLDLTPEPAY